MSTEVKLGELRLPELGKVVIVRSVDNLGLGYMERYSHFEPRHLVKQLRWDFDVCCDLEGFYSKEEIIRMFHTEEGIRLGKDAEIKLNGKSENGVFIADITIKLADAKVAGFRFPEYMPVIPPNVNPQTVELQFRCV